MDRFEEAMDALHDASMELRAARSGELARRILRVSRADHAITKALDHMDHIRSELIDQCELA